MFVNIFVTILVQGTFKPSIASLASVVAAMQASPSKDWSDTASTCSGVSSSVCASQKLTSLYMSVQQKNAKHLMDDIGEDIQLQLLVREFVDTYKAEKEEAEAAGFSIEDSVRNTQNERKRKATASNVENEEEEREDDVDWEDDGKLFRRGQMAFSAWSQKMINAAMHHCDPKRMTKTVRNSICLESKKEMMEMGLGLRLFFASPKTVSGSRSRRRPNSTRCVRCTSCSAAFGNSLFWIRQRKRYCGTAARHGGLSHSRGTL